tara:strand:- start:1718 stop:2794 length:1077 start_codon:yes stop_codon:yes gene_type:complete
MICIEEKLLVNVLYRPATEILNGIDIHDINFENLIKLASGHLMLPALFFNIQKKKVSYLFPEDFIAYIKNIYAINKARNIVLLAEAKELSELLYKNNINHIFLKGTALLLSNVFEDIGERMISDIDFIIQYKDEEKAIKLFKKNNYVFRGSLKSNQEFKFKLFKPKHLPRLVHKNKIMALELHTELLNKGWRRFIFNSKALLNDFKKEIKMIKTPCKPFMFDHCIYALQINDKTFFTSYHFHRSIYDIYKLDCKKSLRIKNIKKDIFIKHFFLNIAKFKIFDIAIRASSWSFYFDKLYRFLTISFFKILFIVEKFINKCSIIIQLFSNNNLRKRALNKITYHHSNKSLLNYMHRWLIA